VSSYEEELRVSVPDTILTHGRVRPPAELCPSRGILIARELLHKVRACTNERSTAPLGRYSSALDV